MKNVLKRIAIIVIVILAVVAVSAGIAYVATNGDYRPPATVDTDPTLPQITLGSHAFHSETFGSPENPTLVVLHGGPGGDYRYLLNLQVLADDYFVVFYDQRGSGLSTRVEANTLTTQDMIDDLDLFVEHYSPDQPIYLIGHSWGAMLAAGYIGQHPEKVAKVVLAEPGALTDAAMEQFLAHFSSILDVDFMLSVVPVFFEALHIADAQERADYIAGRTSSMWENDPANPYHCPGVNHERLVWRSGAAASDAILANARHADGTPDLSILSENAHNFTNPVLFLASACNAWLGEDLQRQQAALFPVAEVVVIENAGHNMFIDNPEASLAAVRAYFNES
ncbi:MAG: alpha/beta hydrolase [Anaerolineaceae bacterium]|nr:alpha/beta hydrolase [Anaerolineaceae bacterium]